jgi:ferrous iron transport protein B
MAAEVNNGKKIFNFASGISLLLFYAFALQCASTLAITRKTILGMASRTAFFMSGFAYIVALISYQILK